MKKKKNLILQFNNIVIYLFYYFSDSNQKLEKFPSKSIEKNNRKVR